MRLLFRLVSENKLVVTNLILLIIFFWLMILAAIEYKNRNKYSLDNVMPNPALYRISIKDLRGWMDKLLSNNKGTLSTSEDSKYIVKEGKKKVLSLTYKVEMNARYKDLVNLLIKFTEQDMVNRVSSLKFTKTDNNLLKISLNFEAVAYEEN